MTRPDEPKPYPGDLIAAPADGARLCRTYRDVLGRPMSGTVTITGSSRTENGGAVTIPAPVNAELVAGVLDVTLPPDTYRLEASLRSADGARVNDTTTVTLGAAE